MLRSSLLTASAVLLCSTAFGQQQVQAKKANMPLKDAGIYHVSTGTWTRSAGETANLGPDVIFRADAPSGYFGVGWENAEGVDEGILPGTQNLNKQGPQDSYCINGFQFGYCSVSGFPLEWDFNFYESYVPCDLPDNPANCLTQPPNGVFNFAGLPANGFCWLVTVDLMGGFEFSMAADGGSCAPGYQGSASGLDHFGWGAKWRTQDGGTTGPLLWGHDPLWVPEGDGTCYCPAFNNPCAGNFASALGCQDLFGIGAPFGGCFFFGGYINTNGCGGPSQVPPGQFAMLLFTDCATSDCGPCFSSYCDTNPLNAAVVEVDNCDAADGRGVFTVSDPTGAYSGNQFGYMLQSMGNTVVTNPNGAEGDLCVVDATLCRYNKDAFTLPGGGSVTSDLTTPNTGCTDPAVVGQTWNWQAWHRDGMNLSKFSNAITVTYQ